jgi:hypothetical protein
LRTSARVEQTRQGLLDLQIQFRSWLGRRRKADVLRRHNQQLKAIEEVVEVSLDAIDESLAPFSELPARQAYEACRNADHQVAFVRRLWDFFRERWDQRDDPSLTALLAAADEVTWSCYQPPFRHLQRQVGPAPLTYVTPDFSAHAIGRHLPPTSLRKSDELLSRTVETLPVPLIGLPYSCVNAPWWLVLIAHEAGHQVAYAIDELEGGPRIADLVTSAAGEAGAEVEMQRRWRSWSHEVFADAYAAATVGAAHLWTLVELEQGDDETMVRDLPTYPPPIVRHELVACVVERLGLAAADAVPAPPPSLHLADLAVSPEAKDRISKLLEIVPSIAEALATAEVLPGATLVQLTGWDPSSLGGEDGAGWWRDQFRQGQATPEEELEAARLATVGALAAWAEIALEPEPSTRQQGAASLREQILATLPSSREKGVRASRDSVGFDAGSLAKQVAADVLDLSVEDALIPELVGG